MSNKGKTSDSNDMIDMNGMEEQEGYERQPTATQGEGKHHRVHVFFILQHPQNIDKRYQSSRWD